MIDYTWEIKGLQILPPEDNSGLQKIFSISFMLIGTDGEFSNHIFSDTVVEDLDTKQPFIQISDLTEEICLNFLLQQIKPETVEYYKRSIKHNILIQKTPPVKINLPWKPEEPPMI